MVDTQQMLFQVGMEWLAVVLPPSLHSYPCHGLIMDIELPPPDDFGFGHVTFSGRWHMGQSELASSKPKP